MLVGDVDHGDRNQRVHARHVTSALPARHGDAHAFVDRLRHGDRACDTFGVLLRAAPQQRLAHQHLAALERHEIDAHDPAGGGIGVGAVEHEPPVELVRETLQHRGRAEPVRLGPDARDGLTVVGLADDRQAHALLPVPRDAIDHALHGVADRRDRRTHRAQGVLELDRDREVLRWCTGREMARIVAGDEPPHESALHAEPVEECGFTHVAHERARAQPEPPEQVDDLGVDGTGVRERLHGQTVDETLRVVRRDHARGAARHGQVRRCGGREPRAGDADTERRVDPRVAHRPRNRVVQQTRGGDLAAEVTRGPLGRQDHGAERLDLDERRDRTDRAHHLLEHLERVRFALSAVVVREPRHDDRDRAHRPGAQPAHAGATAPSGDGSNSSAVRTSCTRRPDTCTHTVRADACGSKSHDTVRTPSDRSDTNAPGFPVTTTTVPCARARAVMRRASAGEQRGDENTTMSTPSTTAPATCAHGAPAVSTQTVRSSATPCSRAATSPVRGQSTNASHDPDCVAWATNDNAADTAASPVHAHTRPRSSPDAGRSGTHTGFTVTTGP